MSAVSTACLSHCQHMNRTVTDSRPKVIGGMRSTRRRSTCKDCGHRWSSYEFDREQLVALTARIKGELLDDVYDLLDRHAAQSSQGAVLEWFGATGAEP